MKTVAIYSHKGGVGKTMTAVNLSYNLTVYNKRVLLVDMDQQGNASSLYRCYDLSKKSVYDILTGKCIPSATKRRTRYKNLDIIPANIELGELRYGELPKGCRTLAEALFALAGRYDYCIIDCPPSAGMCVKMALMAADEVIIPIKASMFAKEGLSTVLDTIADAGEINVAGCLFTMFSRNATTLNIISDVINTYDCPAFENVIRRSSSVEYSEFRKKPLLKCASRSTAALDYMDFTEEFLKKGDADGKA